MSTKTYRISFDIECGAFASSNEDLREEIKIQIKKEIPYFLFMEDHCYEVEIKDFLIVEIDK